MDKNQLFNTYFAIVDRYESHPSKTRMRFYLNYAFQDIYFEGRSMLEVGGGSGLTSLYAACMGAKSVVCLEPELAGATKGELNKLKLLCDNLPPPISITPKAVTFQEFDPGNQTFDIILLHHSINHLDEEACINLQHNEVAREKYRIIFQKLSEAAAPNAKLVIADCSRYNFFASMGLGNPFTPTIEWHKHQSPKYWSNMLSEFGFVNPQIHWTPPLISYLGKIAELFLGNRLVSYFTTSHFYLIMDKR